MHKVHGQAHVQPGGHHHRHLGPYQLLSAFGPDLHLTLGIQAIGAFAVEHQPLCPKQEVQHQVAVSPILFAQGLEASHQFSSLLQSLWHVPHRFADNQHHTTGPAPTYTIAAL